MIKVCYAPRFVKKFKKLPLLIRRKAVKQEKFFRKDPFNPKLKTHRLKGELKDFWSFSITYQYRIMFTFESNELAIFIDVGTHSIYHKQ